MAKSLIQVSVVLDYTDLNDRCTHLACVVTLVFMWVCCICVARWRHLSCLQISAEYFTLVVDDHLAEKWR